MLKKKKMLKNQKANSAPTVHKLRNWQSDILGLLLFVGIVAVGVFVVYVTIFRSYLVVGPSMEPTFFTGDRIIINRLPITAAALTGQQYLPERGEIIVFKNPQYQSGTDDQYIVKRVVAYPNERVVVRDCILTVYNKEHPSGFDPYEEIYLKENTAPTCFSGTDETLVTDGHLYVVGDHHAGDYSLDSRNHLGTVPFGNVIGPVSAQVYPFNKLRLF